jgi:hypothetical protein
VLWCSDRRRKLVLLPPQPSVRSAPSSPVRQHRPDRCCCLTWPVSEPAQVRSPPSRICMASGELQTIRMASLEELDRNCGHREFPQQPIVCRGRDSGPAFREELGETLAVLGPALCSWGMNTHAGAWVTPGDRPCGGLLLVLPDPLLGGAVFGWVS